MLPLADRSTAEYEFSSNQDDCNVPDTNSIIVVVNVALWYMTKAIATRIKEESLHAGWHNANVYRCGTKTMQGGPAPQQTRNQKSESRERRINPVNPQRVYTTVQGV